jgi:hypothetical protein
MSNIFFLLFIISSAVGFSQQAEFSFVESSVLKWGKVPEGTQLEKYVVFENTGSAPLIIKDYKVACACTKIQFPVYPISPNHKDSILVQFDTNNKFYHQDRVIEIYSNHKKPVKLKLKVYVIPKEEE